MQAIATTIDGVADDYEAAVTAVGDYDDQNNDNGDGKDDDDCEDDDGTHCVEWH